MKKSLLLFCGVFIANIIFTQNMYVPLNIQDAMGKLTRSASGAPGAHYWQNSANYSIKIKFHPDNAFLEGTEKISYYNNSPDTLDHIVIQLFPDYYKKGANREYSIDAADENDGVAISKLVIDGIPFQISADAGDNSGTNYDRSGTNLTIYLEKKIIPHSIAIIEAAWSYTVNKGSENRTGMIGENSYFLAYTFPRVAVYDDIDGWNTHNYNGLQEFYNDFGNFNAEITVPKNFVVWATGDLTNPAEVFVPVIQSNLEKVMLSDSIQFIIDKNAVDAKQVTQQNKWNTFKFDAEHVSDFAFALSDHYVWQSSSLNVSQGTKTKERRVRVDAVYDPKHTEYSKIALVAHQSVDMMSHQFPAVPFPYAHETVFDGLDEMEYPMMVNDVNVNEKTPDYELYTAELTSHEIFHSYFPFYMGINETKYAWMDEGWATLGEHYIGAWIMHKDVQEVFLSDLYNVMQGTEKDVPMITISTQINDNSYWENSYGKPALIYLYAREILGDEKFFSGLYYYMEQWNGKHPTPYDFFNCMNTGSGVNLNWFWNAWCCKPGYADVAIMNMVDGGKGNYTVVVANLGNKPVPVDLTIEFADGRKQQLHASPVVWESNNIYYFSVKSDSPPVRASLGSLNIPDANTGNNVWKQN